MKQIFVFASLLLAASAVFAFDPVAQRDAQLKSLFNVRATSVSIDIDYRFFEPIKPGESMDSVRDRMVVGRSPIDAALQYDGRITKNLASLLSTRLSERFSVRTVDWKSAPYQIRLRARINQSLDLYGANMFEARIYLEVQEFATANSGLQSFVTVSTFLGQTFARTKEGVEGMVYEGMDKAVEEWAKELEIAKTHCGKVSCQVPTNAIRMY